MSLTCNLSWGVGRLHLCGGGLLPRRPHHKVDHLWRNFELIACRHCFCSLLCQRACLFFQLCMLLGCGPFPSALPSDPASYARKTSFNNCGPAGPFGQLCGVGYPVVSPRCLGEAPCALMALAPQRICGSRFLVLLAMVRDLAFCVRTSCPRLGAPFVRRVVALLDHVLARGYIYMALLVGPPLLCDCVVVAVSSSICQQYLPSCACAFSVVLPRGRC